MMRFGRILAAASVALSFAVAPALAQEKAAGQNEIVLAQASKRAPAVRHTGTHVYLLRGFMDIFSTGMDELTNKLNRAGIRASVHNHSEFGVLAEQIGDRYRRGIRENVVIVGHSLGANDAFSMADRLNDYGISVPLIITFDPTANMSAGRNVQRVVNFYSSTNGWGTSIGRGPGFRGSLSNVDLSRRGEVGHTDIDKSPALHSQSIGYIRSIGGGSRAPATAAAPKQESKQDGAAAGTKPAESAQTPAKPAETAKTPEKPAETAKTPEKSADTAKPAETAQAPVKDMAPETTASAPKPAAATETGAPKSN